MKIPKLTNSLSRQHAHWRAGRTRCALIAALIAAAPLATGAVAGDADAVKQRPQRLPTVPTTHRAAIQTIAATHRVTNKPVRVVGHSIRAEAEPTAQSQHDFSARWLRSTTSSASAEVARRMIEQASREYGVGAWFSAETSAWESLRFAAQAVDLADRESGLSHTDSANANASATLEAARQAILEARDFSGTYGPLSDEAIARMARSHQTNVLDHQPTSGLSATDAADRYLDHARVLLAPIASRSVEAAQAMDLLAAIYLGRADVATLPSASALCFRRAALQGQPTNASLAARLGMHLADLGLNEEARWALQHSILIEPRLQTEQALARVLNRTGQDAPAAGMTANTNSITDSINVPAASSVEPPNSQIAQPQIRIPQITQLSPEEFAMVSKPVMPASRSPQPVTASLASAKTNSVPVAHSTAAGNQDASMDSSADAETSGQPGIMRRFLNSMKSVW